MQAILALLRSTGPYAPTATDLPVRVLLATTVAAGFGYGMVMGMHDGRLLQGVFSGIKVPLLLLVSTALSLPSFYVINSLLGLRTDFQAALRGIAVAQAVAALGLLSFSPVVALGYVSSDFYPFATIINGSVFLIASLIGQVALAYHYRPLIAANHRHRYALAIWLLLYFVVAIQSAWTLRPFIGWADIEPTFLREEAWGNAYVKLFEAVGKFFRG